MPRSSRGVSLLGREVTGFMPNENMSVKNFAGKKRGSWPRPCASEPPAGVEPANYEWLRLNSAARDVKAWNTSGFGILVSFPLQAVLTKYHVTPLLIFR